QMTATENRQANRCPAPVFVLFLFLASGPGSGRSPGPVPSPAVCVRACRLVFVIPGSMSSIKIYLSDFS
ncbi:hypothetical protein KR074_005975, partial [Drosophila pseudoananassae]